MTPQELLDWWMEAKDWPRDDESIMKRLKEHDEREIREMIT